MTEQNGSGCVHELLGAPTLVHRQPQDELTGNIARPWGMEAHEARYLHRTHQELARVRSQWYHPANDHPFQRRTGEEEPSSSRKKRKIQEKNVGDDKKQPNTLEIAEKMDSHEKVQRDDGSSSETELEESDTEQPRKQQLVDELKKDKSSSETELEFSDNEQPRKLQSADETRKDASSSETELEDSDTEQPRKQQSAAQSREEDVSDSQGVKESKQPQDVEGSERDDRDESTQTTHGRQAEKNDDESLDDNDAKKTRRDRKSNQLLDPEFLRARSDPVVQAAREHLLASEHNNDDYKVVTVRSYQQYDHPYLPGRDRRNRPNLPHDRRDISRTMHQERMNADPAYLATFDYPSLHYSIDDNDGTTKEERKLSSSTKRRQKTFPIEANSEDSPLMYGNCLVCTPCPCDACCSRNNNMTDLASSNNSSDSASTQHSWCLLHPTGDMLSSICISNLILPRGERNSATLKRATKRRHKRRHELDIGETILQITPCGNGQISSSKSNRNEGIYVVRSANYCTVIQVRTDRPKTEQVATGICSGMYRIEEISRIDLRSFSRSFPSYKPMDVTAHPRYGNMLTSPKLAVLSRSRSDVESDTIHHVSIGKGIPLIEKHCVPSLKSISCIDFTSSHPMTLWAAAESYVRPRLVTDIYSTKPLFGHGHSLYTVDLRSNEATFQWSPSAEDMVVEGVHSISEIMTDWTRQHKVWVSSLSAGKTYEIDDRMPCRAVNTFSLAYIADEGRSLLPSMGIHGGGSILNQPVVSPYLDHQQTSSPVLSVNKTPGASGLHVYQRPEFLPRFQTNSLECIACPGLSSGVDTSIARSSCFPLPDVSDRVFTCGLASFQTRSSEFLSTGEIESLGYASDPESVLCTLTMTNKGDLYSHSLLECSNREERRSQSFPGLPLGCSCIPVPTIADDSPTDTEEDKHSLKIPELKASGGWNFPLSLSNEFPLARAELSPMSVKCKKDCRPFTKVRLEHLPTYSMTNRGPVRDIRDPNHLVVAKAAVKLATEYTIACHEEVGRLRKGFSLDKKSDVEGSDDEDGHKNGSLRSDMTADIFQTANGLWTGQEDIADHTAAQKAKENLYHASV